MTWHSITISMGWLAVASGVVGTSYQLRRVRTLGVEGVSLATWVLFVYMGCFWITYGIRGPFGRGHPGQRAHHADPTVDRLSSGALAAMGRPGQGLRLLRSLLRRADAAVGLGRRALRHGCRHVDQPCTTTGRADPSSGRHRRVGDLVVRRRLRMRALDSLLHR